MTGPTVDGPTAAAGVVRSLSVMFPCYNDAPTIGGLVDRAQAVLSPLVDEFEVVVVNDGSGDGSRPLLDELALTRPWLKVVHHSANRGYGGALISGFGAARGEWIFYTDGDGQYDPADAVALLALTADDIDVVQGFKTARLDTAVRGVIGRAYHGAVRLLFALPVRDTDCDFRVFRRRLVVERPLTSLSGAVCVEMMHSFARAGARFVEAPVAHHPRSHGRSQFFRPGRVARTLVDVAGLWLHVVVAPRVRRRAR